MRVGTQGAKRAFVAFKNDEARPYRQLRIYRALNSEPTKIDTKSPSIRQSTRKSIQDRI